MSAQRFEISFRSRAETRRDAPRIHATPIKYRASTRPPIDTLFQYTRHRDDTRLK